jgi:hypothetical protein
MRGFKTFLLQEKTPMIPPDLGGSDGGAYLPLGKDTKNISSSLAKLITSLFFHWNEMGHISSLKRSISLAIELSDTDHKEHDVLNILEPISKDGQFPPKVFVPPLVRDFFQDFVDERERIHHELSDNEIEKHLVSNIYNLIWSISGGKSGTEWEDHVADKGL